MKNKFLHILSFIILISVLSELLEHTFSLVNDDEVSELSLQDELEEEDCEEELEEIFKPKIFENRFIKFLFFEGSKSNKIKVNATFVLSEYSIEIKAIPVPPPELIG